MIEDVVEMVKEPEVDIVRETGWYYDLGHYMNYN